MKIGVLYTLSNRRPISFNPGDDIVLDGQQYLLGKVFGKKELRWEYFNTYFPGQWFSGFPSKIQSIRPKLIWPLWYLLPSQKNRMRQCDYLINAAGPRLYMGRRVHALFQPWQLALSKLFRESRTPAYICLGFGSNMKGAHNSNARWLQRRNKQFCTQHCGSALVVTCRETMAAQCLAECRIPTEVIPCPSILARRHYSLKPIDNADYVALNFHTASNRELLPMGECDRRWMHVIQQFVAGLDHRKIRYVFVFHEQRELDLARKYFPVNVEENYILPKNIPEFLMAYGNAILAITSRVHGAYAAASFGVPSACIGGDSRMMMINLLGLPSHSCVTATADELTQSFDTLMKDRDQLKRQLLALADASEMRYLQLLRKALPIGNKP